MSPKAELLLTLSCVRGPIAREGREIPLFEGAGGCQAVALGEALGHSSRQPSQDFTLSFLTWLNRNSRAPSP
jgi:hypothetical protein